MTLTVKVLSAKTLTVALKSRSTGTCLPSTVQTLDFIISIRDREDHPCIYRELMANLGYIKHFFPLPFLVKEKKRLKNVNIDQAEVLNLFLHVFKSQHPQKDTAQLKDQKAA